jgi:23S rRNA pseudouridine1911/1915/1917 synthase
MLKLRFKQTVQSIFDVKKHLLFEDNHILVILKPCGILSQGDKSGSENLLDIIKQYIINSKDKKGNAYLGLVHRLDRPCSGVMVFAKTSKAASRLSESFRERYVDKHYICVINGIMVNKNGYLENKIIKLSSERVDIVKNDISIASSNNDNNIIHSSSSDSVLGKLYYKVINENKIKNQSVLHIELETGRKHQIRAQLSHAGYPIVGDVKYGASQRFNDRGIF